MVIATAVNVSIQVSVLAFNSVLYLPRPESLGHTVTVTSNCVWATSMWAFCISAVISRKCSSLSPAGGNGSPLQYSWLGSPTERGAWQATVHGVAESDTTEHTHMNGWPGPPTGVWLVSPLEVKGKWKSLSCSPKDYTVHGILQARILEWVVYPFSRGSSQPRYQTQANFPILQADSLPAEPLGKPKNNGVGSLSLLQQIFLTQESNRGLPRCWRILYQLSYQGSPSSQ